MTKLLDRKALGELGITASKVHLWRLVKNGKFPRPISLHEGRGARLYWVESEIIDYLKERIKARQTA